MKFQTIKFPVPAVFPRPAIRASRNCHAGFLKPVAVFLLFNLLALGTLVLPAGAQSHPPTNFNATVPVYQIIQAGATGTQASNLANGLNIPPAQLTLNNGLVSYLNPNGFLTFPTNGITNVPIVSNLVAQTSNQFPSIPIAPIALNFAALSNLSVLPDAAAMTSASNALKNAGLLPQFGTPFINHVLYTAFFSNADNTVSSNSAPLDTDVEYQFVDPNGYPIIGPGEEVQFSYNSNGGVTRLHYSACQLSPQRTTQLMSGAEASNRVTALFPPGAQINFQAVYWSPPFTPIPQCPTCPPPPGQPMIVIPWYYCTATVTGSDPIAGTVSTIPLMSQMIPATTDPAFVPAVQLTVSAPGGGTNVIASVSATGGSPPYTYQWGGSDPSASTNTGASLTYTPLIRVGVPSLIIITAADGTITVSWPSPSDGFFLESTPSLTSPSWNRFTGTVHTNSGLDSVSISPTASAQFFRLHLNQTVPVTETVTVTVTDANGISVNASQSVAAEAVVVEGTTPDPAIDYGCESPYDPGLGSGDRANWLTGMGLPGGGSQRFCWTGSAAWPGDFIEPKVPGVLGAGPWTVGDADFSNWGVNSADIVLYIGHGNPNVITFVIYGNERSIGTCGYVDPQSLLWEPYYQQTLDVAMTIPTICGGAGVNYNVPNYIASWRNGGPTVNDNLFWLSLLSCEVLQEYDGSTPPAGAWTRWGPAFNCLHILTGFDSNAGAGTGFPFQYAANMLVGKSTIVESWLSAAHTKGTGTAAAMGPIGPSLIWDFNDHYWGMGPVGASIPANEIRGWWYIKWPWALPVTFP